MTATVYNLFTKQVVITEICLDLPSDLPEQLVNLIKRMPEKRDYILSCQNESLPNYVGYCTQYTGKEADSFMHMDRKYQVTFNKLSKIKTIYTRSDLIAHDDYIDNLNKKVSIFIVYNDDDLNDKDATYKAESDWGGCPSYKRRLKAFEKLKSLGFKVKMLSEKQFKAKLKMLDKLNAAC